MTFYHSVQSHKYLGLKSKSLIKTSPLSFRVSFPFSYQTCALRRFYLSISKLISFSFLTNILPSMLLKSSERHYHLPRDACHRLQCPLSLLSLYLLPFSINHSILLTSVSQISVSSLSLHHSCHHPRSFTFLPKNRLPESTTFLP